MSQIPFRVFARVPAPGVKPDEMFIPQYLEGGQWRSFSEHGIRKVTFATEQKAHLYIIGFIKKKLEQNKRRIELLERETDSLTENLHDLNAQLIGINARTPQ
uniref:Uncharacterized protein n=1 Tax=Pseudomonas phage HRDY3 TaxID=3236930 RepID=A0AB39CDC9_9VIRU